MTSRPTDNNSFIGPFPPKGRHPKKTLDNRYKSNYLFASSNSVSIEHTDISEIYFDDSYSPLSTLLFISFTELKYSSAKRIWIKIKDAPETHQKPCKTFDRAFY